MSLYGKFSLVLIFLLMAGSQLQAQWGPFSDSHHSDSYPGDDCREISLMVTDVNGVAIMGADVATDNRGPEVTTDAQGYAAIPCRSVEGRMMPVITVTAPGYRPTKVNLMPDNSRLEVRLDRRDNPVARSSGSTVTASELSMNVQKQSAQLQGQAERAISDKDYDEAEKLLMEALQLTPSAASIANNLGIVAMRKNDLDTAASWFQKAVDEAPYKSDLIGNLGLVRWMQYQYEESYVLLIKAFSRGYRSHLGDYILGTVGLRKGNSKEALEHLKKTPADRFPYRDFYLSLAFRSCGKDKAADESFQNFLRLRPAPFLITQLR